LGRRITERIHLVGGSVVERVVLLLLLLVVVVVVLLLEQLAGGSRRRTGWCGAERRNLAERNAGRVRRSDGSDRGVERLMTMSPRGVRLDLKGRKEHEW
jgi:hypothetical protein